jgi:hypothetical protein
MISDRDTDSCSEPVPEEPRFPRGNRASPNTLGRPPSRSSEHGCAREKEISMEVQPEPWDGGIRITIQDRGHETIAAQTDKGDRRDAITLYWRGRVDLEHIFGFFVKTCPQSRSPLFGALVFGPTDRLRVDSKTPWDIKGRIPVGANFVRLEHADANPSDPDFVVWSRIDLQKIPTDSPAPDRIAVWAGSPWLKEIVDPLAFFISTTHVNKIPQRIALDSVRKLLHTITPS